MKEASRRALIRGASGGLLAAWSGPGGRAGTSSSRSRPARIKVGQIGVGHGHASKLSVYQASDDYVVVGVVEEDEDLRERARTQSPFREARWLTREQLFNVDGLRLVLVETEVRDLLGAAEVAVAAGKYVHLDKPAGSSLARYRRLLEMAERNRLWVQMGYMYRYNPGIVLLRELLAKGWLGEVFEAHAVMSKVVPPDQRRELEEFAGGMMFELGCHLIDLVVGILGAPSRVTPYARHSGEAKDGLRDNMLAVLEYPRALATVKSSAMEVEGFGRRHLVVCGTEGTYHLEPLDKPSARLALSTGKGGYREGYQDISFPVYERYVADAADMARVIRGEKGIDFGSDHDLATQKTVLLASGMPLDP